MRNSTMVKVLAVFLAVLTLIGPVGAGAANGVSTDASDKNKIDDVLELLATQTYSEYIKENNLLGVTDGEDEIIINAVDGYTYEPDPDYESAAASVVEKDGKGQVLKTPDAGTVSWEITVEKAGYYVIAVTYMAVEEAESASKNTSNIQRILKIDGKAPFKEANYFEFSRFFEDNYIIDENGNAQFKLDKNGNDKRPNKNEVYVWSQKYLSDSTAFHLEPLKFALEAGKHTISLESSMNEMYLSEIKIEKYNEPISYEDYLAKYADSAPVASKDANGNSINSYKIQAEYPTSTSDITIYPQNDRTSPITEPQDAAIQKLNTIGAAKWQNAGQWIEWTIPADAIKENGFYYIVPRFLQNTLAGLYCSRRIYINGEVPFEEASYLQFNYLDDWQVTPLNDGKQDLKFYFEAGKEYKIKMEVVYGNMTNALSRCEASLTAMNDIYNSILRITGPTPDANMDYGFADLIYDTILLMQDQEEELFDIIEEFKAVSGGKSGENVATLEKIAYILQQMTKSETAIAGNLENLKLNSGTLGTWIMQTKLQPVTLDYILIQPVEAELPEANAGFFQRAWFEIRAFFQSFVTDYNSLGDEGENEKDDVEPVKVWISTSRDEAQVMRELIDTYCTTKVDLKLVAGGTILPATLAGIGPDLSLAMGQSDIINYAIRSAIEPLSTFDDYFEVTKERFNDEMLVGLRLENPETGEYDYYGMPERLNFLVMFYRKDIFAQLGLKVPETWDDLDAIVPDLQTNYRKVGMASSFSGLQLFMYQLDEDLYKDTDGDGEVDGMQINFDSNTSLDCFERLCALFTTYKFPRSFDLATYFRMGEMPIAIADYMTYNQFTIYATEIKGLWEFVPLPGTIRTNEDGTTFIDRSSPCTVSAVAIMAKDDRSEELRQNCWEFIKWWTDAPAQGEYAKQYEALLGMAAKVNTANMEALRSMPWTTEEKKNLEASFQWLKGTPEYPGGYIITRYVDFAFLSAYNDGTNPVDAMLDNIIHINNELSRKRKEFGLQTYEEFLEENPGYEAKK